MTETEYMSEPTEKISEQSKTSTGWTNWITFGGVPHEDESSFKFNWNDSALGVKNPSWKDQVRRGKQAGTLFVGSRSTFHASPFSLTMENVPKPGKTPRSTHGQYYMHNGRSYIYDVDRGYVHTLSEDVADNRAKLQITRKIRSKQTSFQGGTFVGELARTVALIKNPAKSLRLGVGSYINQLKKTGPKIKGLSRTRVTEIVRDTWLEYQLGWAPTISEMGDLLKTIAESNVLSDRQWEPVRGLGVDESVEQLGTHRLPKSWTINAIAEKRRIKRVSVRYIACVDIGTHSATSARRMGFAPTNWLPTLWELVPYSFVIDYFSNVGDIISAATLVRSDIRWILKTVRREVIDEYYNVQLDPLIQNPASWYTKVWVSTGLGKSWTNYKDVQRSPYNGSLVPSLVIELPGSGTQWLNIAALAHARKELQQWYR